MPKLPIISGKEVIKILQKRGYFVDHQTGSHIILRHKDPPHRRTTVPNHSTIAKGTLLAILRETGITREELFELIQ